MPNFIPARFPRWSPVILLAATVTITGGCAHCGRWRGKTCETCETPGEPVCDAPCGGNACETCSECNDDCGPCSRCQASFCGAMCNLDSHLCGWMYHQSNAIPDALPLGSTVRAHYQVMETNAEAADFILHRHDFVGKTVQLTPDARDKIPEIAARMRTQPFPVIIERSENNSDPGLDLQRRAFVAQILTSLAVPDADQRTIVAPAYGRGYTAIEAERTYYQFLNQGSGAFNYGTGNYGIFGGGSGGFGGFGGLGF